MVWKRYHTVWLMLFLGWIVSYIDRTLTGPVITWMIENKIAFLESAANPHALGGLLGSLFFAGYMLTQFPGGYFGDKYGHRVIAVISILWAGVTTLLTGLIGGLFLFVALRVLTGLGEGVFYSNDRSLITQVTPPEKVGFAMGLVLSGLTFGLTIATLGTAYVIEWFAPLWGEQAWKAPFLIMGVLSLIVGWLMYRYMKPETPVRPGQEPFAQATAKLLQQSVVFLVAIMLVYYLADSMNVGSSGIGLLLTLLACVYIAYIYKTKKSEVGPVLKERNLILLYLSFIPVLWHLWFYGFWSVAIVKEFGGGALTTAALVASFNAIAGLIGFPLGGKLSDMVAHKPNGRRNVLFVLTALLTVFIFIFTYYMAAGNKNLVIMSVILFLSGLLFFALQPITHVLTGENAPPEHRGSAFGMLNLIAEIGALLAPVISGALRDNTGDWTMALILDGVLMGISSLLVLGVKMNKHAGLSNEPNASL
ncbi:MFS transporter [Bacillaceae bacterium]